MHITYMPGIGGWSERPPWGPRQVLWVLLARPEKRKTLPTKFYRSHQADTERYRGSPLWSTCWQPLHVGGGSPEIVCVCGGEGGVRRKIPT